MLPDGLIVAVFSATAPACGGWAVKTENTGGTAGSTSAGGNPSTGGAPATGGAPSTGGGPDAGGEGGSADPADFPRGFHAVGDHIEDADGNRIVIRGVNRSGTEYQCSKGAGIFDGPSDEASIVAMKSWNINAVRIPLNESCWLALPQVLPRYSGDAYRSQIGAYVERLHAHAIIPIIDLHWAAPGSEETNGLRPMPNRDHSAEFWSSVARYFLDDDGVILEPYNEPFPDLNRDTDAAWQCWRDGCDVAQYGTTEVYAAEGMQALVDAIRGAGSEHLLLLGGVQYSNALAQWLAYMPDDPLGNLGAAWHVYNNNACRSLDCWTGVPAELAKSVPVVATEIGQNDCLGESFLTPLMQFLDENASGYLAWSWNAFGSCEPAIPRMSDGAPWDLITDYETAEPNSDYARTFRDHLAEVAP
jgi:hypothetical protein